MCILRFGCSMLDAKMRGPSRDRKAPMMAMSWGVKCMPVQESRRPLSCIFPCLLISCTTAITLMRRRWYGWETYRVWLTMMLCFGGSTSTDQMGLAGNSAALRKLNTPNPRCFSSLAPLTQSGQSEQPFMSHQMCPTGYLLLVMNRIDFVSCLLESEVCARQHGSRMPTVYHTAMIGTRGNAKSF